MPKAGCARPARHHLRADALRVTTSARSRHPNWPERQGALPRRAGSRPLYAPRNPWRPFCSERCRRGGPGRLGQRVLPRAGQSPPDGRRPRGHPPPPLRSPSVATSLFGPAQASSGPQRGKRPRRAGCPARSAARAGAAPTSPSTAWPPAAAGRSAAAGRPRAGRWCGRRSRPARRGNRPGAPGPGWPARSRSPAPRGRGSLRWPARPPAACASNAAGWESPARSSATSRSDTGLPMRRAGPFAPTPGTAARPAAAAGRWPATGVTL
jgi:hypothetical protein